MSTLATTLPAFLTDRLVRQRQVSPNTVQAYRDTMRLLLVFASECRGKPPGKLDINDLHAPMIGVFLDHLEHGRKNGVRTRNARLAAIRSLFRYAALRHPEHAATIERVRAIPPKRCERWLVTWLTEAEIDALLPLPDRATSTGRRDTALISLAVQTGLRASELIGLNCSDFHLEAGAHVSCTGKGRKQRITPLTSGIVAVMGAWLAERADQPADPLLPTRTERTLSRDAVERRLPAQVADATVVCPSLARKRVTMHVLRHSAAMRPLCAGIGTAAIALWLGREQVETTQIYCTRILGSRNAPSKGQPRSRRNLAANSRPTNSSPSSKASDYAAPFSALSPRNNILQSCIGIIRASAQRSRSPGPITKKARREADAFRAVGALRKIACRATRGRFLLLWDKSRLL